MFEKLKKMIRELTSDDELFTLIAQSLKKAHTALIKEGFTEDQATHIVAGQGLGVKTN